jgi:hypothetical protein
MTLNILNDSITSNHTTHTARLLSGDEGRWEVSWLPGQSMDRTHAVAAMGLADLTRYDEQGEYRLSPDLIDMAAELLPGLDGRSSTPTPPARTSPGRKSGELSDPEAGG